jgi:ATP-dependent 26S proteasome regulatory subunit
MTTPEFATEMAALIRSRTPLVYLVTTEERRVLEYFRILSAAGGYRTYVWDCYNGLLNLTDMKPAVAGSKVNDPIGVLDLILAEGVGEQDDGPKKGNIYLLLDFHRFMAGQQGSPCTPDIERRLRTIHRMDSNTVVVMTGPVFHSTTALEKCISVIDFPYPNRDELKIALYNVLDGVVSQCPNIKKDTVDREEEILGSVSGLTLPEAEAAFAKSVVTHQRIDIPTLLKEKQQIIRKTGVLQFFHTEFGMDDIGGLSNLTDWLKKRRVAFGEEAKKFGVSAPRGVLLIGVPGGGKSLSAKAVASYYSMPLLRLDFGALFQSLMGESEKTARHALKLAEALAPCVLWIDELEKGLAGVHSSGKTDSGVTARVISTFLTWMQERTAPVFIVATANQHENIPTEFLRRFDEIFFVDLPGRSERVEIVNALLKRKARDPSEFDVQSIAIATDRYTGAEIEKGIDAAILEAYVSGGGSREMDTADVLAAMATVKPVSAMRAEVIEGMQAWAEQRCVRANTPESVPGGDLSRKRTIELPNE